LESDQKNGGTNLFARRARLANCSPDFKTKVPPAARRSLSAQHRLQRGHIVGERIIGAHRRPENHNTPALNGHNASALKLVRMLLCSPREEKKTAYIYCRDLAEPLTKLLQAALLGRFLQLFAEVALAD
jgi:hypothetical protein